jgi:hypothetical protein
MATKESDKPFKKAVHRQARRALNARDLTGKQPHFSSTRSWVHTALVREPIHAPIQMRDLGQIIRLPTPDTSAFWNNN